jgi:hypothetical protein
MFLGSKFLQKFSHTSFGVANSENYTDKISKLLNTRLLIPNKSTGGPKKNVHDCLISCNVKAIKAIAMK